MIPTQDQFKAWTDLQQTHPFYKLSVEYYEDLRIHADGLYPAKLIDEARPTESSEIKDYRKKIFQSPTQGVVEKVFNSVSKIRKATDYSIDFSKGEKLSTISEKESLENYCVFEYPKHTSVDNWIWSVAYKQTLIDPNAFELIYPAELAKQNEYLKPYGVIYNSPNVIDYVNDEWCFVKSEEKYVYTENGKSHEGNVYIYADKEFVLVYKQNSNNTYLIDEIPNVTKKLPVVRFRGIVYKETSKHTLYKSRLHSMLPYLHEAAREYSDLQGSVVQSMFPTPWIYGSQFCGKCNGTGKIPKADGSPGSRSCKSCEGSGGLPNSPYKTTVINLKETKAGTNPPPTPVGGFIEKDTKSIEIQDVRVDKHLYKALKSVNMEHLDTTPLNQSGLAKEWDRSEANNFVGAIAEDIVYITDATIELTSDWRYSVLIPDQEKRDLMLPVINVPVKYDIATDSAIAADIQKMKDGKFNPVIVIHAEVEYAQRVFNANPDIADKVKLMYDLDPLAGRSSDDIISDNSQGWISKESGVIHANIKEFIERAVFENKDFVRLDLNKQKEIISKYAKDFIKVNSVQANVTDMATENVPSNS